MMSLAQAMRLGTGRKPVSIAARALAAIRRAGGTVLAAGAATPVLGVERVTNGTFDTDTDWALSAGGGGSSAITGGSLVLSGPTSSYPSAQQDILTAGKRYQVTFTTTTAIASGALGVRIGGVASSSLTQVTAAGTYTIEGVADGPSLRPMRLSGFSDTVNITSISAKEVPGYTYGNPPVRNYFDSAGTDILDSVTQVDQPVGLVVDAAGTVGPELAGLSTPWQSYGTGISLVGGQMVFTAAPAGHFAMRGATLTANKTYELEITIPAISGGGLQMLVSGGAGTVSITTPGTYRGIYKSTNADGPYLWVASGTVTAVVTVASCRELPGNHATQATTGSKPTLRRGLVNQLLWSGDFTNAVWTKRGTAAVTANYSQGLTRLSGLDTVTSGDIYQLQSTGYTASGAYTPALTLAQDPACTSGVLMIANPQADAIGRWLVDVSLLPTTPTIITKGHAAVTVQTEFAGVGTSGGVHIKKSSGTGTLSVLVGNAGVFQGTVTAQQILAAGGIPLTTTAPASSALGNYWWQLDPTAPGDFLQTSITAGNEGWVCAGVTLTTGAPANQAIAYSGADADINAGIWLAISGGQARYGVGNGTARNTLFGAAVSVGMPHVIDGGHNAANIFCGLDGVELSAAKTVNCTTSRTLRLGMTEASWPLQGAMPVTVICPTLPPPADRALIRKWVGSLQGQTL